MYRYIYVIYPLHIIIKVVVRKSEKKNEIKCSLRGHKNVMHNLMFHIQKATLYPPSIKNFQEMVLRLTCILMLKASSLDNFLEKISLLPFFLQIMND